MHDDWGFPNQATPPGSSIYYSIRFSPRSRRRDLALVYACCAALRSIPDECTEPQVARTKLAWWQEELDRALAGMPRHPLTRSLAERLPGLDVSPALFARLAGEVANDITGVRYASWSELMVYCRYDLGIPMELLARCNGLHDENILDAVRQLGAFIRVTGMIQSLGGDLRKGRCYIPDDLMQEFNLSIEELSFRQRPAALTGLLAECARRARLSRDQSLATLPKKRELATVFALGAIADATLDELVLAKFPVLDGRLALTPLRKLGIAWLAGRRLHF